jgi:hypothetical protein
MSETTAHPADHWVEILARHNVTLYHLAVNYNIYVENSSRSDSSFSVIHLSYTRLLIVWLYCIKPCHPTLLVGAHVSPRNTTEEPTK